MRKLYLLLPALLLVLISFGQTPPVLPMDFESATINYTFSDFGGGATTVISNPQSNGINTSAKVGKMIKGAPEVYGGSFISLASPMDFSANKTFKVKVFMPRVGTKLLLKVENQTDGGINFEKEATGTVANAWEELSFDFSTISTSNQYQKIVLIFDLGTAGDGSANFTYLFDDITLTTSGGGGPVLPTLPLDFESGVITYSFTDFDGGGTTKITNSQSSGINTSGNVAKMIKSAGQPWGGSWLLLASPIDFSVNKTFKIKVFMPRVGAKLLLKVEDQSNSAINFEKEATGTVANAWEELTFDYSTIGTANQYQKMTLIFDLGTMGDGTANFTYLFDDIMLTNSGGGSLTQMNLPVSFDLATIDYGLVGFGGAEASSIVADPTLSSNKVAKVIKSAGAELWAGTTVTAINGGIQTGFSSKIPFTASETKMNIRVWSPNAGIKVRLKVEDHTDPNKSVETEATTTVANTWETLEFNFASQASGTAALNLAFNYNKASIFFNFGVTGAAAGEKTYYFDDIQFGASNTPPPTSSPVLPLTFESAATNYAFTDFDGGGTTKIANAQMSGINTSANVARMIKSPGQVWGGSWISLAAPIDFSVNKFFRVKVFMPRVGAKLLLKVENQTDGGIAFEKEATGTVANAWEELFFDYSTINTTNQYQKLVLIFDLGTAGDGTANFTYLFDDITLTSGALAVKLISFDAKLANNKAVVKWTSESEINHDHYEVERSDDGIHFASRGKVNGNGNSSVTQTYQFADDLNAVPAIVYYRLKIVDNSGKYSYSKTVALNINGLLNNGKFNSYPNPFTSGIKVSLSSKADAMAGIRIISLEGKELINNKQLLQKGNNIVVLKDLEKLPKGNYILEVTTPTDRFIKKIMKN